MWDGGIMTCVYVLSCFRLKISGVHLENVTHTHRHTELGAITSCIQLNNVTHTDDMVH